MKRRSFLAMLGLAPMAAVAAARLPLRVEASYTGPLTATDFQWFDEPREYLSMATRGTQVSLEPYIDTYGLVPRMGEVTEKDGIVFRSVTHHFTDQDGVDRLVWLC